MKNNWVRLIAGVLVSVALVGAISLTGGMKKGSRTDGLLYEAVQRGAGVGRGGRHHPDR